MIKEFGLKSAIKYETKMRQGVRKKVRLKINEMYIKFCITDGVQNVQFKPKYNAQLRRYIANSLNYESPNISNPSPKTFNQTKIILNRGQTHGWQMALR